ncbi:hypothetical protein FA13DRAFT_1739546 [Coprinellus micaceus]|uniref:NACHT domain-containing protein n=1 Tax=Coprinellus micaceus TaxID=71717 RepID=A0A4Y7SQY2_COPMI|nr:hypothetical protein FA13DRAFT_1739546 [Coprinellus micaceus]
MSWIRHGEEDDTPMNLLWLSGPAGSGKTAIAGTIADECYKEGLLAASFFFSAFAGSKNRRWKKPVIPSLVYRLIQHKYIVGLKEAVLTVIEDDPMVFERHLDQQLEELVLKPLRKVAGLSDRRHWPEVIIVDGLDECQGNSELDVGAERDSQESRTTAHKEILSALSRACADPSFPFRIVIASRPEPVIRHFFSTSPDLALNIFLDDRYDPDSDIRLFLEAMFSDIRRRFKLPSTWAPRHVVDLLVKEASGQFIYAATVIRFLDNPRQGPPQKQLSRLLEWRRLDNAEPFAPLDALYKRILHTSPDHVLSVKWLLLIYGHSSVNHPAWYLQELLESYPGETEYVLGNLTSLVGLADEQGGSRFRFYHKSLLDFLGDPSRSSELYVDDEDVTRFTQKRYYDVLRGRGPQANTTYTPSRGFTGHFCKWFERYTDRLARYSSSDVEWWLTEVPVESKDDDIPCMFASIHKRCRWYHCLPACDVWRKGILQYCEREGWRIPTASELFQDRFKKFGYMYGANKPEYPLRDPPPRLQTRHQGPS